MKSGELFELTTRFCNICLYGVADADNVCFDISMFLIFMLALTFVFIHSIFMGFTGIYFMTAGVMQPPPYHYIEIPLVNLVLCDATGAGTRV